MDQVVQAVQNPSMTDAALVGVIVSHVLEPMTDYIPSALRPAVTGALNIGAGAALEHFKNGTPWGAALGAGIASAVAGFANHAVCFRDGNLFDAVKSLAKPEVKQ